MTAVNEWPSTDTRIRIGGRALSATIVPERGGKIISLLDATGREWLATPDRIVGPPARPGDDFLAAEMAGWDECAPTIVACRVGGTELADHGELWTMDFTMNGSQLSVHDPSLDYSFTRAITPTADGLTLDYAVTAGATSIPFLWAGHPQFCAPRGSRIILPTSVSRVVDVMDPALPEQEWSPELASIDTISDGGYRKVYVHPDEFVSTAQLVHPDGRALQLSWSPTCPYLGLWFDKGAFRREPIIAIEPATAYFDSLATAVSNDRALLIPAGETVQWSISITALA